MRAFFPHSPCAEDLCGDSGWPIRVVRFRVGGGSLCCDSCGNRVMYLTSSAVGAVSGALAVGVAGGADDEADAGLVEAAEGVVKVDGDADGDAGGQPQYPVLAAAAGEVTGIAAGDGGLPVDLGQLGDAVGERGAGADKAAKSSRCSHPVLMRSSQAASR